MTKEFKNNDIEMTAQMRILHVLSDKNKRLRLFEDLVSGLDRNIFSQVTCYLSGDDNKSTKLETWGHDVISLHIYKKKLRRFQPLAVLLPSTVYSTAKLHGQSPKCLPKLSSLLIWTLKPSTFSARRKTYAS